MLSSWTALVALLALSAKIHAAPLAPRQTSRQDYINNAMSAKDVLINDWYDASTGRFQNLWWNSANAITTLADLVSVNPAFKNDAVITFESTYTNAPGSNGGNWLNDYYDDEGWWALAWIKVYDITNDGKYLSTAQSIFEDLLTGFTASCGGEWWDKPHTQDNSINNELFLSIAAHLANRVPSQKSYYQDHAVDQANWFLGTKLLSENNTFHDGFSVTNNCEVEGTVWTYNQGVILGGLVELAQATGNSSWLDPATKVAQGAVKTLVDGNGIMTETGSYPTNDNDADQFKGVLARNLAILQAARGDSSYVDILTKSADSIWQNDRNSDGQLGPDYQGPVYATSAPAQSSAMDCIIAAAMVS
ncbi:hypothetical protein LTR86_001017 [Recurvomyces mirabilis]|nr:hypothetical protein LTR86_001017 [Recurvomyces mirabilis]